MDKKEVKLSEDSKKVIKPAPKKEESKPVVAKKLEAEIEPPKPQVPLKVFLAISGYKPDQIAGFKYFATKKKIRALPMLEWKSLLADFMNKPVK